MLSPRRIAFVALLALGAAACSRPFEPAPPVVEPGPMPQGREWQGVYSSLSHGDLHILVTDQRADAAWRTPDGVYGEFWGAIDGNEVRYVWRESRRNASGNRIPWFGRGYFVYTVPGRERPDELIGEWGLDQREVGERWIAVKRDGKAPDLDGLRVAAGADDGETSDEEYGGVCITGCDSEEDY
jgi:hypothetical protein